ncbi:hypothetical protein FUAX_41510 (plasmid) [Fulvitalea axinellae]|uniref:DKNYY family protein n=1 Tax=Fulvitalea axinellae TaxID=1182444 RepID=A0AAU9DAY2_9BACT|nr:hypothetical protein FUAX_41510 [Fulvitalea axinellae]
MEEYLFEYPKLSVFVGLIVINGLGKKLTGRRNGPVYSLFLLIMGTVFGSCSTLGERVKKSNNNFYYSVDGKEIRYSPSGNWFELGNSPMPEGLDIETFEVLDNYYWAKDKNRFYYRDVVLDYLEIDRESFVVIDISQAKDKNKYYAMNRGDWSYGPNPIKVVVGADPETFEDEPDRSLWSKDAYNYFYEYQKANLDAGTFSELTEQFVRDKDHVYLLPHSTVEKDESISFEKLDIDPEKVRVFGNGFIRDNENLYYYCYNFQNESKNRLITIPFEKLSDVKFLDKDYLIIKDKVYYDAHLIEEADAETFRSLERWYKVDKNALYIGFKRFPNVDFETLKYVEKTEYIQYYQDKNFIYHSNGETEPVEGEVVEK